MSSADKTMATPPLGPWIAALALVFVAALAVQTQAGLALRGLYADGAFFTTQLLQDRSFVIFAGARWLSSIIVEAPTVLAMSLGVTNAHRLAMLFDVSTTVMPGLGFLLCLGLLPRGRRGYFLFPTFVYFAGTLSANFASITEGLLATAYLWCLFVLLCCGPDGTWRRIAVLLLALGTSRMHEATFFLCPIMILPALGRLRACRDRAGQAAYAGTAILLAAGALIGLDWVIFPFHPGSTGGFLGDFLHLRWLYMPGAGMNLCTVLGILAGLATIVLALAPRSAIVVVPVFAFVAPALALASFDIPKLVVPSTQFFARDNGAFLSFGLMLLMLAALRWPGLERRLLRPSVACVLIVLGLSVSLWHVAATKRWEAFTTLVSDRLATGHGVLPWSRIATATPQGQLAASMVWPWTNPDLGIALLPRRCIAAILDNPPNPGWHPYDLAHPATLPRLPGVTYTYLETPAEAALCTAKPPR